jgi:hypothetical protein
MRQVRALPLRQLAQGVRPGHENRQRADLWIDARR